MPKYTKYLEFSQKERTAIRERDNYRCIFCQIGYEMPPTAVPEMDITDIMAISQSSQMPPMNLSPMLSARLRKL